MPRDPSLAGGVGLFVPTYALWEREAPLPSFAHLAALGGRAPRLGVDVVSTLPLYAAFLDEPFDPSPYSPMSRLHWNEVYVDDATLPVAPAAGATELVDWRTLARRRRRQLLDHAGDLDPSLLAAVTRFVATRPDVADFARYRAAHPEPVDAGRPPALVRRSHELAQHLAHCQLAAVEGPGRAALGLDLPIGSHPDGYETWAYRPLFASAMSVGAPPDEFFADGQNWGFPPQLPAAGRRSGHELWQRLVARAGEHASVLRIDHVMGVQRLWWIPEGASATDGVYVRYPRDELLAVIAAQAAATGTTIVGEDLGTVPHEITEAMDRCAMLGMYEEQLLLFRDDEHLVDLDPIPARSVVGIRTHDMPAFAAVVADRRRTWCRPVPVAARGRARAAGRPERLRPARRVPRTALGERRLSRPRRPRRSRRRDRAPQRARSGAPHDVAATPSGPDLGGARNARCTPASGPACVPARQNAMTTTTGGPPGEVDLHLFNEGTHRHIHRFLGAHPDAAGSWFAVWAPNAARVAVVGDFTGWQQEHPLEPVAGSGLWAAHVPDAQVGQSYRYTITTYGRDRLEKADPVAAAATEPPATASVIADLAYSWGDDEWMADRAGRLSPEAPVSIYEVHLGSWGRHLAPGRRFPRYEELADPLADHAAAHGFTHVELLPVMEHPFYGSWGYQTTGYFAPTARYGSPTGLMAMIDGLHQRGVGVILDWVPSHFPMDAHGLARFDGTYLYEHADPRQGFHPDWSSAIFNYGRAEVRAFLVSSAISWLERYHADGLRVDAVASMLYLDYSRQAGQWIPNRHGGRENLDAIDFLRQLTVAVAEEFPATATFAEESTAWPGVTRGVDEDGLGFDFKWDMGWMHDTLQYVRRQPVHRRWHNDEITFRSAYAFSERYVLPLSHDEVVHGKGSLLGKMPGDEWQRFANLRLLFATMWAQPGKKLLFMGGELAMPAEWDHESTLPWDLHDAGAHAGVRRLVADLNQLHLTDSALHRGDCDPAGFEFVVGDDDTHSVFAWLRRDPAGEAQPVLVVLNATPTVHYGYRVGVPVPGRWVEVLNTDAEVYGGSGTGNLGGVLAEDEPRHGFAQSVPLTLPPLAAVFLRPA